MFGRKALPFGTIVILLVIAVATAGLGYAWWSTSLADSGVVQTGSFQARWTGTFTDDGGHADFDNFDVGDVPCATDANCVYPKTGPGSESARDPSGPGPNGSRTNKAIGACASSFTADDPYTLHWSVSNAYPGYYCTVWSDFSNTGSVPMNIVSAGLLYDDGITTGYVEGHAPTVGNQVDPSEVVHVGMWVRVDGDAVPGGTYNGSSNITLVQWNAQ